jgi:hypothetical protein
MLMAALAGTALAASAQNDNSPRPDGPPPGPPPEAVAACKGKAEGSKVQFSGREGEKLSGTCRKLGEQLAAMPDGMPPPPQR